MRFSVIVHPPEIITIRHGRKSAVERKDFESMAGEIEVADDFGPKQRNNVGADREPEAGKNLFCHCSPAEYMPPLKYQNFFSGAREIGRIGETVVASPDHDNVIFRVSCHVG